MITTRQLVLLVVAAMPAVLAACRPLGPASSVAIPGTSGESLGVSAVPATSPSEPAVPIPSGVSKEARALPARLDDVAIIGDSLTVGAQPYLPGEFAAAGSAIGHSKAQAGIPTSLGLDDLQAHTSELPGTVILALGTNDAAASRRDVVEWLVAARRIIGPDRRLFWVNLSIANPELSHDAVVNAVLAESAARDPRLAVLDWDTYSRDHRIGHAVDGVHYSDAGYRERAWFYTCAVVDSRACRPYQLGVRGAAIPTPQGPPPATRIPTDNVPASSGPAWPPASR